MGKRAYSETVDLTNNTSESEGGGSDGDDECGSGARSAAPQKVVDKKATKADNTASKARMQALLAEKKPSQGTEQSCIKQSTK